MAVGLGLALSLAILPGAADAAALTAGGPDSAGNYAACSVAYTAHTLGSAAGVTYLATATGVAGLQAYTDAFQVAEYCNTTYTSSSIASLYIYVGNVANAQNTTGVVCSAGYTGNGCSEGTSSTYGWGAFQLVNTSLSDGGRVGYVDQCFDPSVTSWAGYGSLSSGVKSLVSQDTCTAWSCYVAGAGSTGHQCAVQSAAAATTVSLPAEPGDYWTGQSVAVPATPAPSVTCQAQLSASGLVGLSSSTTAVAGTTDSYSWALGDGSAAATTANVNHAYSVTGEPTGGYVAVLTVTATGDGAAYSGTASTTCTKVVDFLASTAAGGGTTPSTANGGVAPPASCNPWDVLCFIEQAAAWLFVPSGSFFSAWSSFVNALQTHVPFSYVANAATFLQNTATDLKSGSGGSGSSAGVFPNGLGVLGSSAASPPPPSALQTLVYTFVESGVIVFSLLGIYKAIRRTLGEH